MSTHLFWVATLGVLIVSFSVFSFVRRDYRRRGRLGPWTAAFQFLVFTLHATLMYLALIETSWPDLPALGSQRLVAIAVGGVGLGLVLAGMRVFRSIGRIFGRRSDVLEESSVYGWSRNPQLVGYAVFLLAFVVLWPSWKMAVAMLVYVAIGRRMIQVEEEHLLHQHGADYAAYCERTPRFLRLPWTRSTHRPS